MAAYGAYWVTNNSSTALTRLGGASAWAAGAGAVSNFNGVSPWSGINRVNLWTNGTVTATHGDRCYTDTDVANMGNAMTKVPAFYSYVDTTKIADGTTPRIAWWISNNLGDVITNQDATTHTIVSGDLDPAFSSNGIAYSKTYVGSYHSYLNGSVLESVAGYQPTTYQLLGSTLRAAAQAVGTGWNLMTMQTWAMLQRLYLIEYANWDFQSMISVGISNLTAGSSVNNACNNGHTSIYGTDLGNASGSVSFTSETTAQATQACSYRGVENIIGNVNTLLEGVNIGTGTGGSTLNNVYVADHGFAVDTYTGAYSSTGIVLPTNIGTPTYTLGLAGSVNWPFIPATGASGRVSDSTYIPDFYENAFPTGGDTCSLKVGGGWCGSGEGAYGAYDQYDNGMFAMRNALQNYYPNYFDGCRLQFLG